MYFMWNAAYENYLLLRFFRLDCQLRWGVSLVESQLMSNFVVKTKFWLFNRFFNEIPQISFQICTTSRPPVLSKLHQVQSSSSTKDDRHQSYRSSAHRQYHSANSTKLVNRSWARSVVLIHTIQTQNVRFEKDHYWSFHSNLTNPYWWSS